MAEDRVLLTADASWRQQVLDLLTQALGNEADLRYGYVFGSFVELGPFHDVDVAVLIKGTTKSRDGSKGLPRSQHLGDGAISKESQK